MTQATQFPPEITEILGHYVYLYINPLNEELFYVGKGVGNRVFEHLFETTVSEKTNIISEIRRQGAEPKIELLRYGLSERESALIEATIIDLIGTSQLSNKVRGIDSRSYGRISVDELVTILSAEPVEIRHNVILITINRLYRGDMTPLELYEATRGIWKVGRRRERADYAFAVNRGIVREAYRIDAWYPAVTLDYETRDLIESRGSGRWEFEGSVAEDIREEYVGKSARSYLGKSSQNPIRYVNV